MYAALLLRKYPRDREQIGDDHHQTKAEKEKDRDSNEEKRLMQDDDVLDVKKIEETIRNKLVQKLNDSLKINKFQVNGLHGNNVEEDANEAVDIPYENGMYEKESIVKNNEGKVKIREETLNHNEDAEEVMKESKDQNEKDNGMEKDGEMNNQCREKENLGTRDQIGGLVNNEEDSKIPYEEKDIGKNDKLNEGKKVKNSECNEDLSDKERDKTQIIHEEMNEKVVEHGRDAHVEGPGENNPSMLTGSEDLGKDKVMDINGGDPNEKNKMTNNEDNEECKEDLVTKKNDINKEIEMKTFDKDKENIEQKEGKERVIVVDSGDRVKKEEGFKDRNKNMLVEKEVSKEVEVTKIKGVQEHEKGAKDKESLQENSEGDSVVSDEHIQDFVTQKEGQMENNVLEKDVNEHNKDVGLKEKLTPDENVEDNLLMEKDGIGMYRQIEMECQGEPEQENKMVKELDQECNELEKDGMLQEHDGEDKLVNESNVEHKAENVEIGEEQNQGDMIEKEVDQHNEEDRLVVNGYNIKPNKELNGESRLNESQDFDESSNALGTETRVHNAKREDAGNDHEDNKENDSITENVENVSDKKLGSIVIISLEVNNRKMAQEGDDDEEVMQDCIEDERDPEESEVIQVENGDEARKENLINDKMFKEQYEGGACDKGDQLEQDENCAEQNVIRKEANKENINWIEKQKHEEQTEISFGMDYNEEIGQEKLTRSTECYVKVCNVKSDLQESDGQKEKDDPVVLVEKEAPVDNKLLIQKESPTRKAEPRARMLARIHNEADNGKISTVKRETRSLKLPEIQKDVKRNRSLDRGNSLAQKLTHGRKKGTVEKESLVPDKTHVKEVSRTRMLARIHNDTDIGKISMVKRESRSQKSPQVQKDKIENKSLSRRESLAQKLARGRKEGSVEKESLIKNESNVQRVSQSRMLARIQNEGEIGKDSLVRKNQLVRRESRGQKITQINMEDKVEKETLDRRKSPDKKFSPARKEDKVQKESPIDQTKQQVSKEPGVEKEAPVESEDNGKEDPEDEIEDESDTDSGSESDSDSDSSFTNSRSWRAKKHKRNRPSGRTDVGGAGIVTLPVQPLSEYERIRAENIKEREAMLKFLNIHSAMDDLKASMGLVGTPEKSNAGRRKWDQGERRKTPRTSLGKVYYYGEPKEPRPPREKRVRPPMEEYVEVLEQGDHTHVGLRKHPCYKCFNCIQKDCRRCVYCKDKSKYGGANILKQRCITKSRCLEPRIICQICRGNRKYICVPCNTAYNDEWTWQQHRIIKHGEIVEEEPEEKRTTRSQAALSSEEQNVNDMTIVEDTPVRKRTTRSLGVVPSSVEKKPIKKRAARSQGGPSSIEATPVKKRKIQRSVPSLKKDPPVTQRTIRAIGRGTVQKRTTRSLGTPYSIEKDANYLAIERGITRKRKPKPDLLSSVEHGLIKDEARNNETKENGIKLVEMNQLNGDEECRLKELCESSKCSARIQRCDTFSSDKDGNVKDENNVSKKDSLGDRMEQVVSLEEPNMLFSDNYVPLNNDSLAEDGEDTRLKSLCANIKCSVRLNMYNCNLFKEGKYEYGKHDEDLGLEEGSLRRSITGRRNSCGTGRKRRHASTC